MVEIDKNYSRFVLPIVLVVLIGLSIWLLKPFLVSIVTGAVLAYLFYPVYKWLLKFFKNRTATALIVSILIGLIILLPIIFAVNVISSEAYYLYIAGKQRLAGGPLIKCNHAACEMIKEWMANPTFKNYAQQGLDKVATYLIDAGSRFLLKIPTILLNVFVTFFVVFYLLIDGPRFVAQVKNYIALKRLHHQKIIKQLDDTLYGVVYGNILIALAQGLVAGIGFYIFGVSTPIVWGVVVAIAALIPYIGTAIVWAPISIVYFLDGYLGGNQLLIWKGVGLFIYGLLLISSIDNILKPKLIGDRAKIHPVVVLVGMLGGLSLMGIAGFIVGPVLLAMTISFIDIYLKR